MSKNSKRNDNRNNKIAMSRKNNKRNNKKQESVNNKINNKKQESFIPKSSLDKIINFDKTPKEKFYKTLTLKELMEKDEEGKILYEKYLAEVNEEKAEDKKKVTKKRVKEKAKPQEIIMAPAVVIEDEDDAIIDAVIEDSSTDSDSNNSIVEVKEEGKMETLLDIVQENVSKKVRKKINRIINKYLPQNVNRKYVSMGDGLYKVYILSKDGSELIENIIDPFATITGGTNPSIYKKGLNPDGSQSFKMVDLTDDKNLSTKLLSTKSFITDNGFYNSFNSEFTDPNLDLSGTQLIDKFNESQEQVFMGNIYSCLNSLANARIQIPRFRFSNLKSENQFTLISDFKCKVPLKYESFEINGVKNTLNFNGYIDNGRVIVFNNGTITTYYTGNENNKLVLSNAQQTQQQQPVTQQQMINNAAINNMANGFMQQIPNMASHMIGGFVDSTPVPEPIIR